MESTQTEACGVNFHYFCVEFTRPALVVGDDSSSLKAVGNPFQRCATKSTLKIPCIMTIKEIKYKVRLYWKAA